MKRIAILLTVHNRKLKTLKCLQNIYKLLIPEGFIIDVFLTDDGCTDGTSQAIKELYPEVNIIEGNGNLYWNRGMYNAWLEASKYDFDFYLWLNDDTFVFDDVLIHLINASNTQDDKSIIVGCTQSERRPNSITYGGRLKNGNIPIPDGKLVEIDYFNGNIVLVPKFVFKKIGNLDYNFTHGKGDFDYGLTAKSNGIRSFQVGCVLGYCESHSELSSWCNPRVPLKKRWKSMLKPNGMPPKETFYLTYKHNGMLEAIYRYIMIYIRCLFPYLWNIKNKHK